MIHPRQLLNYIIYPTLSELGFDRTSEKAKNAAALLLYTCKQESDCGRYIHQVGGGPALGIMQMEPATFNDICDNYLSYRKGHVDKIMNSAGLKGDIKEHVEQLMFNLKFSVALARIHYLRTPPAIPEWDDLDGMWSVYKKYYNTHLGAATFEEFKHNFEEVKKYLD